MKKMLFTISIILSSATFAEVSGSNYEARHLSVIEKAISTNCGNFRELTQIASSEVIIQVDQGIRDIKYATVLTGLQRMDQNIFDRYSITVESEYADMYDHQTKNWGIYHVTSVSCVME